MGLLDLWKAAEKEFSDKTIRQIISIAGEGRLSDGNVCSKELRDFLGHVPSEKLDEYAESCLVEKFEDGGFALQDIVNELGRRLGFSIGNGRYRGVSGKNGYDGLWRTPDGHTLIVEVKTTDAYRINLDTAAGYRADLIERNEIEQKKSSILLVVGRQDTGDLEAQIRGSRHAWDIRLISVDALLRLLAVKEETDDPSIHEQISLILRPREYTRLDSVVDLVFAAAEDLQTQRELVEPPDSADDRQEVNPDKPALPSANFHEACINKVKEKIGVPLVRESRSLYASSNGDALVCCCVSKEYLDSATQKGYWYAFHPHQVTRLHQAKRAFVAFGCGSAEQIVLIPFSDFEPLLKDMNVTRRPTGKSYWHVVIRNSSGRWVLVRKAGFEKVDVSKFLI